MVKTMKSMTGYGRGVATAEDGTLASVEISSVNSKKQVEMRLALPRELMSLEGEMKNCIQGRLIRGTLNVQVSYKMAQSASGALPIDENIARIAAEHLRKLAAESGLAMPTIGDVLMIPGVLQTNDRAIETLKPLVMKALDAAISDLDASRSREGAVLHDELKARGDAIAELVEKIHAAEQEAVIRYRDKLIERIAKLGLEVPVDDDKLAKEVVFYVDKSDITEETVRLKSHISQYYSLLEAGDDVGRNLDFLSQEMTREANTLSVKATDMAISDWALALKVEISKIKEQVMNVQ